MSNPTSEKKSSNPSPKAQNSSPATAPTTAKTTSSTPTQPPKPPAAKPASPPRPPTYDNPARKDRREDPTAPPCRDWLMGLCDRTKCMFYHPPVEDANLVADYIFCPDYAGSCSVLTCRLIHAHADQIARYRHTNLVDIPLAKAIAAVFPSGQWKKINGTPICNEFQETSTCTRPIHCRYWHINVFEERAKREAEIRRTAMEIRGEAGGGPSRRPLPHHLVPGMLPPGAGRKRKSGLMAGGGYDPYGEYYYSGGAGGSDEGALEDPSIPGHGFFNQGPSHGGHPQARQRGRTMMGAASRGLGGGRLMMHERVPEIAELYASDDRMPPLRYLKGELQPWDALMAQSAHVRAVAARAAAAVEQDEEFAIPLGEIQQQRIVELERQNAELLAENGSLKRELKREKNRYEDLVQLFRQTAGPISASSSNQSQMHLRGGQTSQRRADSSTPESAVGSGGTATSTWAANSADEAKYNWGTMMAAAANAAGSGMGGGGSTSATTSGGGGSGGGGGVNALVEQRLASYYAAMGQKYS